MKKNYPRFILLVICHISFMGFSTPHESLPLEELLKTGKVSAQFTGKGGYQNACMELVVKNLSADSVIGFVEPGRKLNSLDDGQQDILVVKAAVFKLKQGQTDTLDVIGFCCQSTKAAPSKGSFFSVGALAPAAWLIIANLINRHPFPPDAIQHAVWVLSDKHDIRSIPAYKNPVMDQLRYAVADILDIELPWYSFRYKSDSTALFSGVKTHFFAEVPFTIPFRAVITPQICNLSGDVVYTGEPTYFRAGENVISVEAPLKGFAETEYDLYLMEDFHTQNKKMRFTLED
jgi:hypothetical protein